MTSIRTRPALVLAATLLAALGCHRKQVGQAELPPATGAGAAPRPALPALAVATAAAEPTSGDTTGTTFPRARAEIAPTMSGVIASIPVAEGSVVKKGDVLFRLRTTDMALRVRQAETAAQAAGVALAAATEEYARVARLLDKNAIDRAQVDRVKAQLDGAQAGVDQAKVGVAMAQQALGDATVRSPIDGVITLKLKSEGEMATMMPPSVVVVVEDHSVLELRFRLPEGRLGALAVGAEVSARFAAAGVARSAKVVRLAPNVDLVTRTIEVVANLDNHDGALKAGMLAQVSLPGAAPAPAPAAPTGAVQATP